ncbi:hypothetical protein RJ641_016173 [Dillenia turbinata]|uniref:Uncharacterized protein n=1 Tax=Dillenia turbinata TaxID=194707 RepID=A0AAN8UW68_9MAGN
MWTDDAYLKRLGLHARRDVAYIESKIMTEKAALDEVMKLISLRVPSPKISSKKLLDLGFNYKYGLEEMFDGATQSCKEKGFI